MIFEPPIEGAIPIAGSHSLDGNTQARTHAHTSKRGHAHTHEHTHAQSHTRTETNTQTHLLAEIEADLFEDENWSGAADNGQRLAGKEMISHSADHAGEQRLDRPEAFA